MKVVSIMQFPRKGTGDPLVTQDYTLKTTDLVA